MTRKFELYVDFNEFSRSGNLWATPDKPTDEPLGFPGDMVIVGDYEGNTAIARITGRQDEWYIVDPNMSTWQDGPDDD